MYSSYNHGEKGGGRRGPRGGVCERVQAMERQWQACRGHPTVRAEPDLSPEQVSRQDIGLARIGVTRFFHSVTMWVSTPFSEQAFNT